MLDVMRYVPVLVLCVMLGTAPAFGGAQVGEGPLSPCVPSQDATGGGLSADAASQAWGVVIATAFSKEEALEEFKQVKQDHSDIIGSYEPIVVETCDLHMGTKLQYSARIGLEAREDADNLCDKLRAAGAACIVQKN